MAKKILLEMTEAQFSAFIEMIAENAITIGGADEEFTKEAIKRVNLINKMLKNNNINHKISW